MRITIIAKETKNENSKNKVYWVNHESLWKLEITVEAFPGSQLNKNYVQDVSQTTTYRIVIPDKQTGPLPVIHRLDLEKLEIFIDGMKKETMKVIGNSVKHINTAFEKWKKSQQKQTKKLTNTQTTTNWNNYIWLKGQPLLCRDLITLFSSNFIKSVKRNWKWPSSPTVQDICFPLEIFGSVQIWPRFVLRQLRSPLQAKKRKRNWYKEDV